MSDVAEPAPQPTPAGRDAKGRFAPGSPGGPGRPRSKSSELLRAAQDAVTPDHMRALIRKALMMGLGGNLGAMKFVADRCVGRAGEPPTEGTPLDISLPKLRTIDDCTIALDRVTAAMVARTITMDEARVFIDVIGTRVKAIEAKDLEQRLAELEKAAATVAPTAHR